MIQHDQSQTQVTEQNSHYHTILLVIETSIVMIIDCDKIVAPPLLMECKINHLVHYFRDLS